MPQSLTLQKRPRTEGLHLDQSPFHKPNLETIQGMVPLLPVTLVTGGLVVVPESHLVTGVTGKKALKERYPHLKDAGDWCPLPKQDVSYQHQLLLEAEAGDLILWGDNLFFFIFFKIFCFIFSFIFFFNFLSFWFGRQAWL